MPWVRRFTHLSEFSNHPLADCTTAIAVAEETVHRPDEISAAEISLGGNMTIYLRPSAFPEGFGLLIESHSVAEQ